MNMILIVSNPEDRHAFLVQEALRRKGVKAIIVHTSDFPTSLRKSVCLESGSFSHLLQGRDFSLNISNVKAVWWRRPVPPRLPEWVHPSDKDFAYLECREFSHTFWQSLDSSVDFWVNKFSASSAAEDKLMQQKIALCCGLEIPATLYSNDPDEIRKFIRASGGRVVYKVFRQDYINWISESSGRAQQLYTSIVTEDDLPPDEVLAITPGVFQEPVQKAYEVRLTMIGRRAFAAKINSQETRSGKLDWRAAYHEISLEPVEMDEELLRECSSVLDRLDLMFGCFDFIVTPDGRPVFLEVNQAGQFLWVERYAGLPLLDAFCELLIQREKNFDWKESQASVRIQDVTEVAVWNERQAAKHHTSPLIPKFVIPGVERRNEDVNEAPRPGN